MNATSTQPTSPEKFQRPAVLRRIAMFMMELNLQVSADMMNLLSPQELREVTGAIAHLETVDPLKSDEASHEFQSMKANADLFAKLGSDYALYFVRVVLNSDFQRSSTDASLRSAPLVGIEQAAARDFGIGR